MSSPPEEEIRRTIARYGMFCDDGRVDDVAQLFAPHARFVVSGRAHEGREAIRDSMAGPDHPEPPGRHVTSEPMIEVDGWGGTAKAWTDYVVVDRSGAVSGQGRYHDVLEREGDKVWRFTLREVVAVGDEPQEAQPPPG